MAVMLEFIDLIVPIATIREKYPGGWDACLDDHEGVLGGRVWYDEHPFRDGTMNSRDMENLVKQWAKRGFEVSEVRGGRMFWKDLCVFESLFGGPTRVCDWLVVNHKERTTHLMIRIRVRLSDRRDRTHEVGSFVVATGRRSWLP